MIKRSRLVRIPSAIYLLIVYSLSEVGWSYVGIADTGSSLILVNYLFVTWFYFLPPIRSTEAGASIQISAEFLEIILL